MHKYNPTLHSYYTVDNEKKIKAGKSATIMHDRDKYYKAEGEKKSTMFLKSHIWTT